MNVLAAAPDAQASIGAAAKFFWGGRFKFSSRNSTVVMAAPVV
jgi:hypothetical protein